MHGRYELAAQKWSDGPGENAAWVVPDGIARCGDVTKKTRDAAAFAHGSYATLVSEYVARGMDATVLAITRTSLDRAANDLADLIASAGMDAGVAPEGAGDPAEAPAVPDATVLVVLAAAAAAVVLAAGAVVWLLVAQRAR